MRLVTQKYRMDPMVSSHSMGEDQIRQINRFELTAKKTVLQGSWKRVLRTREARIFP
jgi:hypothetical protein